MIQNRRVNFRSGTRVFAEKNKISARSIIVEWKGHMTKGGSGKKDGAFISCSVQRTFARLSMRCQRSQSVSAKVTHSSVTSWFCRYERKSETNQCSSHVPSPARNFVKGPYNGCDIEEPRGARTSRWSACFYVCERSIWSRAASRLTREQVATSQRHAYICVSSKRDSDLFLFTCTTCDEAQSKWIKFQLFSFSWIIK